MHRTPGVGASVLVLVPDVHVLTVVVTVDVVVRGPVTLIVLVVVVVVGTSLVLVTTVETTLVFVVVVVAVVVDTLVTVLVLVLVASCVTVLTLVRVTVETTRVVVMVAVAVAAVAVHARVPDRNWPGSTCQHGDTYGPDCQAEGRVTIVVVVDARDKQVSGQRMQPSWRSARSACGAAATYTAQRSRKNRYSTGVIVEGSVECVLLGWWGAYGLLYICICIST